MPVFSRPRAKPARGEGLRQPARRRLADPPSRDLFLADMDQAVEKGAGGQHHPAAPRSRGRRRARPRGPGRRRSSSRSSAAPSAIVEAGGFGQQFGDRPAIELAVGLRARPAHRRRPCCGSACGTGCRRGRSHVPMTPSSASISRTRCPLPSPPIAGLHDISPIVARLWVSSTVRAPNRAEAAAASHPACPPPTTTTS